MKAFRTNLMYWRFRYVTRNRLRLQNWWNRRRQPNRAFQSQRQGPYRPRGGAAYVARRSVNRTWTTVLIMVAALTGLTSFQLYVGMDKFYYNIAQTVIIVGALYKLFRDG